MKTIAIIVILSLVFLIMPGVMKPSPAYGAESIGTQQDKVIDIAMSHLGKTAGYFGFYGGWCTQYVNYSMKKAGLANNVNYPASGLGCCRDFAVYYAKKGAYTAIYSASSVGYNTKVDRNYVPKKGDIAIFAYGAGGYIHHVGLVSSVIMGSDGKASRVKIVHGNWSGRVCYSTFSMYGSIWGDMIVGYCTPNYTVNVGLDANGGAVSKTSISTNNDKKFGALPTPEREGYTFLGWFTKKTGGTKITSNSKVSSSTGAYILYAHWQDNSEEPLNDSVGGTDDSNGGPDDNTVVDTDVATPVPD